jgi:EAL domain-containing protein (putative c-di-GMP-specific phosphodiesterase class I)
LYHACKQIKIWNDINKKDLFISVNVSTHQIKDPTFANTVTQILEYTGLSPEMLKIEITESMIMQNPQNTKKNMKNLRDKGIEFSIDDFGTGYSSLNYLKKLPIDTLKIDRSFVIDSLMSHDDREIIKTIIAISKNLGINTVAEGVESLEHKEFLRNIGCKMMQGFYFNKPMPQNELEDIFSLANLKSEKK